MSDLLFAKVREWAGDGDYVVVRKGDWDALAKPGGLEYLPIRIATIDEITGGNTK